MKNSWASEEEWCNTLREKEILFSSERPDHILVAASFFFNWCQNCFRWKQSGRSGQDVN
jgi:hypothetical protein